MHTQDLGFESQDLDPNLKLSISSKQQFHMDNICGMFVAYCQLK